MTASLLTELPFSLPGRIFRSPMPFGRYDVGAQVFELYRQNGVQAVLALPEAAEILEKTGRDLLGFYAAQGLTVYHCPIRDFSVPSQAELERAVAAALGEAQAGRNVAIHCNAGIGRTGLVLACLARRVFGWDGDQAIRWVRQYIPEAVETDEQQEVVGRFGRGYELSIPEEHKISAPLRSDYIPLWYGFVDESGDPAPYSDQPLVITAILTQDSRGLELLTRRISKKARRRARGGELKASASDEKIVFRALESIGQLPISILGVQVDKSVIIRPPEDIEMVYTWAAAQLARLCLTIHPRLNLHFDKRYTNLDRQRWFERWLRDDLADMPHIALVMPQEDSTASKALQAADFVAWAAGRKVRGDHRFWEMIQDRVIHFEVLHRERW